MSPEKAYQAKRCAYLCTLQAARNWHWHEMLRSGSLSLCLWADFRSHPRESPSAGPEQVQPRPQRYLPQSSKQDDFPHNFPKRSGFLTELLTVEKCELHNLRLAPTSYNPSSGSDASSAVAVPAGCEESASSKWLKISLNQTCRTST